MENSLEIPPVSGKDIFFSFKITNPKSYSSSDIRFDFRIDSSLGMRLAWFSTELVNIKAAKNVQEITFKVPNCPLNNGTYFITFYVEVLRDLSDWIQNAFSFSVEQGLFFETNKSVPNNQSDIFLNFNAEFK